MGLQGRQGTKGQGSVGVPKCPDTDTYVAI